MFNDDWGDVLLVVFELLLSLDILELAINILHGSLCLPLDPIGKAVTTDHLDPLIKFPTWVMVDHEVRYFVGDGIPNVVGHVGDCVVVHNLLGWSFVGLCWIADGVMQDTADAEKGEHTEGRRYLYPLFRWTASPSISICGFSAVSALVLYTSTGGWMGRFISCVIENCSQLAVVAIKFLHPLGSPLKSFRPFHHFSVVDDSERTTLFVQGSDCETELRAGGSEADDLMSTSCVVR